MADGDPTLPNRSRDVWESLESLRTETRDARHSQNNATQVALAGLRTELDVRLRSIETTIAAANPQSLGPRLNVVEQWQAVASDRFADTRDDVNHMLADLQGLKAWRDQMSGVVKAIAILGTVTSIVTGFIAVFTFLRPPA